MILLEKPLTGLFKTLGEPPGEIMDSEKLPLLKEMEFVELTCKLTTLLKLNPLKIKT